MAVGSFGSEVLNGGPSSTSVTLAESWNGEAWTAEATPDPAAATASELNAVWCSSTTACIAVGDYYDSAGNDSPLAETWNGTTWSIQTTPTPAGGTGAELWDMSCTSITACTAVGWSYLTGSDDFVTLAEVWNGTAWSIESTPNPAGSTDSALLGVWCSSATACTAVGDDKNSSGDYVSSAETWNGAAWSLQAIPTPAAATGPEGAEMDGVSCTSITACIAVGNYENSSDDVLVLTEIWNGTAWSIASTPVPTGATDSYLDGVSCTSPTACTATGGYTDGSGAGETLAEEWNGTAWSVQSTPNPAGATFGGLFEVACTSPSACMAVGTWQHNSKTYDTLAESWNGSLWKIKRTLNHVAGATNSALYGLSCPSSTACMAVGSFGNEVLNGGSSSTSVTLAESWNGEAWTAEATPDPAAATASELNAVWCSSPTACIAVGDYYDSAGNDSPLAETWNGTVWSIQTTPTPAGGSGAEMYGVSCTSITACTAVGWSYITGSDDFVTLAEVWNGTAWSIESTPVPAGSTYSSLLGVWCSSPTACTAVGDYENSSGDYVLLAETWNGAAWSLQAIPTPSAATGPAGAEMYGVSCTSITACIAVGSYEDTSDHVFALTETWNGTAWSIESTPVPTGAANSYLDGVSCIGPTACTTTGGYTDGSGAGKTLAEEWNGTAWSIQSTPNPAGATFAALFGAACTSPSACIAVGTWQHNSNTYDTLAEAEH